MTELARGTIADRPWGRTLGTLGLRGLTGQVQIISDGKRFAIAFSDGAVIGALSPLASDAAVRVAMTSGLVSSTQVGELARRQAAAPRRDEIEVIAEMLRLAPDLALRLRRRTIAQRAARTFALERGDFVVDDQITMPVVAGTELDVRSVIYLGAQQNISESRLEVEVSRIGAWFRLRTDAVEDLPQFGFTSDPTERGVLERLHHGASIDELEAIGEPHTVRAMVYALVSCNACDASSPRSAPRSPVPTPTATAEGSSRMATPPHGSATMPRTPTPRPEPERRQRPSADPGAGRSPRASTDSGRAQARPQRGTQDPGLAHPGRPQPGEPRTMTRPDAPPVGRRTVDMPAASVGRTADMPATAGRRTVDMPAASSGRTADSATPGRRTVDMPAASSGRTADPATPGRRTVDMPAASVGRTADPNRPTLDRPATASRHATTPPAIGRRMTADMPAAPPAIGRRTADVAARRPDVAEVPKRPPTPDPTRRRPPTSRPPATRRTKADSAQAADVKRLIAQRLEVVRSHADHYQLLGVSTEASAEAIRRAYFGLARQLHPDRLSALGIVDGTREAQRLFAQVNTAFAVLSDPRRRAEYTSILKRGGEAAIRAEEKRAEQLQLQIVAAEEAYLRGELAMRRDQTATAVAEFGRAVELNPDEADYHTLLAWAQFCASPDKMAVASATRVALDRAIARSPRAVAGRFYLGRVERMLGRDADALRHFHEVLRLEPSHQEAASEARMIEARVGKKR